MGLFTFIGTTLWDWHGKFGWHIPPPILAVFFDLYFRLVVWTVAGYLWGAYMWKKWQMRIASQN
jgi:hypothetical protein